MIVIVGPTASGKSALAIKIAKKFNGEIISADSRQIYRGMDIGTAKPKVQGTSGISNFQFIISKKISHYLIDIKNPDENYTVAEYKQDAIKAINKILKKKKLPILVGGTGLYIKSVIDNLNIPEVAPDQKLRKKLEKEIEKYGLKYVFEKLIKLDPEAAYIVDPNNPRRIIRALEVAIKTKKPFSVQRKAGKPLFDFLEIGINWPKNILNKRINKRVDLMIEEGLVSEVKNLIKKYGSKQQSFDAIGYREIINYLNKKTTLNEAKNLIKKNTRHYAKRQMTWFRKNKRIHWIRNEKETEKLVKNFLF
ncbi:tRNA (adenosine(37)-N6)-dimethylallyltransferase MiaA [Candidatus Azambacteria bacterium RIFCSPHIGHO2_01_FULL_40_24]|uniref:tRNA dimethylallyltransferase n=1 Tax=Candidatus Azambacteria bacterium RIFCSPHIGHO2_01_FULL_40_24 TaxID=1797301 RepID=A0A1F5B4W2_9BACT|nr:MAG: tRNA (adenosine(37)-N6)-dimethylallyltransferase MiaA [Candidatus Azambacteria bacterium RIFCSPHIGHO2_01_FULL_40_24]